MSEKGHLKKEMGIIALTALGVNSIVGSGIFALPADMSALAGPGMILSIILAGIIALFFALPYAELGAAFPLTGGPYAFPRLAFGDLGGFMMGWGFYLYLFIGTAGIIDIFIVYLGYYFPSLAHGTTLTAFGTIIAVIAVWFFTFINLYGVKWGSLYSLITTLGKLIPLILFCFAGLFAFEEKNFVPFLPGGLTGMTLAITLFFWSYTGFEALVIPAGEVKKPHRTIPISMILTMLLTIIVYFFISIVYVGMVNWQGLNLSINDWHGLATLSSPLSDVATAVSGAKLVWLAIVIAIGAIIATGGSGGSWILVQARLPYAMAEDKLFWKKMSHINKFGVPSSSLLFSSLLTTIIIIAIPSFPSVALIASMMAVVVYASSVLAVPLLRKTKENIPRPFKLPLHKPFTIVGFILATFLIYWASWPWTLVGSILLLSGFIAFLFVRTKNFQIKRISWLFVYIIGILIVSFIGDKNFSFQNFLPIEPLNYLKMPYDLIVLAIFSVIIYFWAYKSNVNYKDKINEEEI